MARRSAVLVVLWLLWVCVWTSAEPKVQVTGSAPRGDISLTIYNPQVTLVQEHRVLGLNTGANEYRASWAGVNVDRDSVRLEPQPGVKGITIKDAVYVRDDANSVIWHLEAKKADAYSVSVSYNVSGLSWWANHVLTVDENEKTAGLKTWANVANASGEDYQEAQIRLVMGDVRLVSPMPGQESVAFPVMGALGLKAGGAGGGGRGGGGTRGGPAGPPGAPGPVGDYAATSDEDAFGREGYAEYTFYSLERRESLDNGDTKKIELASEAAMPLKKLYVYATDMYGPNVAMLYLFDNKKEFGLGPLPPGMLKAYRQEADGRLTLLGEDYLKYTPVGETARVYLGSARNVTVEVNQTAYRRSDEEYTKDRERLLSYVEYVEYTVEVRNRKAESIEMVVRQIFPAEAELVEVIPKARSPRVGALEWDLKLGAGASQKLVYRTKRKVYTG